MPELIFVTGAAGFLGSHVVDQLLAKGYNVRGAARGAAAEQLRDFYADYKNRFDVVSISDIATDQIPEALRGVHALIHTASPVIGKDAETTMATAIEGTLNIIRQAEKAGVKKIICTSSLYAVLNPRMSFTDKDWNPITKEDAFTGDPLKTYIASKTFAERAFWEFADAHPDLDVTTFCPTYFYGAFAPAFTVPRPNYTALSTNLFVYRLLSPTGTFPTVAGHIDVRDIARAHVLALNGPAASVVGRKRIVLSSPHESLFKEALPLIAEKHPELKHRLADAARAPEYPIKRIPIDFGRVEEVLGMKKEDFTSWEDTVLDAVDSLMKIEKQWEEKGYVIEIPASD